MMKATPAYRSAGISWSSMNRSASMISTYVSETNG